jgi:hypothetical protein
VTKITKLIVGKGITTWSKETKKSFKKYYALEIELSDPSELEVARANALGTIDAWLSESNLQAKAEAKSKVDMLYRGNKLYARILQQPQKLIFFPVESLRIKADAKPITSFLEPRILQNMDKKYGLKHRLEVKDGVLYAVVIEGKVTSEIKEKLVDPVGWALEKAVS